ncbi:MAG: hypothetical protein ACTTH7_08415 [Treponema sp.]
MLYIIDISCTFTKKHIQYEVLSGYEQMPYTGSYCRIQHTYQLCLEELVSIVETEKMQHILKHFISFME